MEPRLPCISRPEKIVTESSDSAPQRTPPLFAVSMAAPASAGASLATGARLQYVADRGVEMVAHRHGGDDRILAADRAGDGAVALDRGLALETRGPRPPGGRHRDLHQRAEGGDDLHEQGIVRR